MPYLICVSDTLTYSTTSAKGNLASKNSICGSHTRLTFGTLTLKINLHLVVDPNTKTIIIDELFFSVLF